MKHPRIRFWIGSALVLALITSACAAPPVRQTPVTAPSPSPIPTSNAPDIWATLREGTGYVVLLRHAQTTPGTGDPPGFRLDDCATQRNLSAEGRSQAVRIGQVFRDRNVPIAAVLTSEWCRCVDTATLMAIGDVQPAPMLNSFFEDRSAEPQQTAQVRQRIAEHRDAPGVIVMVSHMVNITALSGVVPPMGGAVVVRATGQGDIEIVDEIREW
jgi:phosphohistidine phosphatase SixA